MALQVRAVKVKDRTTVESGGGGGTGTMPGGDITHGRQLTINHVGPWALQGVAKGSESLTATTSAQLATRFSTYPGNARPAYIPSSAYVNNNNASNVGGIVPAGGMTIDGEFYAAGTWVVQFRDLSAANVIIEGDCGAAGSAFPGVLFRGCRMRGPWAAPGWYNQNGQSHGGIVSFSYCDGGGLSLSATDYCESVFESQGINPNRDKMRVVRCFVTNATTLVYQRCNGDAIKETLGQGISDFGHSDKHLNGFANAGSQTAILWTRNSLVSPQQSGSANPPSDIFQFAADAGTYIGGGTNQDGSTGFWVSNNYLGGAGNHTLQLGYDKANGVNDITNMHIVGNVLEESSTTVAYKTPNFSANGNEWSGNTLANGTPVPAPAASNG